MMKHAKLVIQQMTSAGAAAAAKTESSQLKPQQMGADGKPLAQSPMAPLKTTIQTPMTPSAMLISGSIPAGGTPTQLTTGTGLQPVPLLGVGVTIPGGLTSPKVG